MSETEFIRIMVVDDHPIVRAGICAIISSQSDMQVTGEYGTAEEAIEAFPKTRPDVVLMDLRLPGTSGLKAIHTLHSRYGQIGILVLTTYEGDEDIHQALRAGAAGYIIKGMNYDRLVTGIRRVHSGKTYVPPEVTRVVTSRSPTELSIREREVLSLMAEGKSNRDIADELGITEGTVKCHVGVVLAYFRVKDRTQAVLMALRRGYVRL
jgi:DNA-binding NarL/FixJ family response regulator